ncbi:hypothetical protein HanLR1_Chr11g0423291 [Helianthus annuus]|nr:hypothetical protein HanLR1_Chr11g0423291 [Helianthus annuus]
MNNSGFNHMTKSLSGVNTFSLMKDLGDELGFVSANKTIRIVLNLIDPLTANLHFHRSPYDKKACATQKVWFVEVIPTTYTNKRLYMLPL